MQESEEISHTLTPDEQRVLEELALGYKDETAARRLGISRRTLRRRVHDAMGKLGADSRFQAGVLYARSQTPPLERGRRL